MTAEFANVREALEHNRDWLAHVIRHGQIGKQSERRIRACLDETNAVLSRLGGIEQNALTPDEARALLHAVNWTRSESFMDRASAVAKLERIAGGTEA